MPKLLEQLDAFADSFWQRVEKSDGCWLWTGRKDNDGYGKLSLNGQQERTHRIAYALAHGPLSPGQILRHTCDCPPCCNPTHLIPGTHLENAADRDQRGRNGKAKLNPTLVCLIRAMSARGVYRRDIAAELGVPLMTVHHAASRRTWKWVP